MDDELVMSRATAESKRGVNGKSIVVTGNMVRLNIEEEKKSVYIYAVYFSRRLLPLDIRKSVVAYFCGLQNNVTGHIFNGVRLFLPEKLTGSTFKIKIPSSIYSENDGVELELKVFYRRKKYLFKCVDLLKFIASALPEFLGLKQQHRIFYDPQTCKLIPQSDLEIFGGYRIRASQTEKPAFIVDCVNCVRHSQTIYDFWEKELKFFEKNHHEECGQGDFNAETQLKLEEEKELLYRMKDFCLGRFVAYDEMNLVYQVSDVTVERINNNLELLLWVWTKAYLVEQDVTNRRKQILISIDPRLYRVLASRDGHPPTAKQKLDSQNFIKVSPNIRVKAVQNLLNLISHNQQAEKLLSFWGLKLEDNLLSCEPRIIPSPTIKFGAGKIVNNVPKLFWCPKTSLPKMKVYEPVHIQNWVVFCDAKDVNNVKGLVQTLRLKSSHLGIRYHGIESIVVVPVSSVSNPGVLISAFIESVRNSCKESKPQFVLIVLPGGISRSLEQDLYGDLKKLCAVELNLVSQMVRSFTLKKVNHNLLACSLLSQLNVKLGGSLWALNIPMFEMKRELVMFVGMDVWHASSNSSFSAAALICSLNSSCTKFYSSAIIHRFRQETFYTIQSEFQLALKAFYDENKKLPDRIMVFRDGVQRREYEKTLIVEVSSFMEAIKIVYQDDPHPFFSVVICQKRVYERFFIQKNGKFVNPRAGTVIDHPNFTRNKSFDYFLVSMVKEKGTVVPTHYVVLYDNSQLTPDAFHEITFALCFGYFNWPGSFYVPCVIQYAHKLAAFVGRCGGNLPSVQLEKQLHFL